MLFIVDGTGPWLNSEYDQEMSGSFCRQLALRKGTGRAKYWRGPSLAGLEVGVTAQMVAVDIWRQSAAEPIFLCGYSRGGFTVMCVAELIRPRQVDAMFLFDAVDRSLVALGSVISANVRQVYHARRNPSFAKRHEPAARESRAELERSNQVQRVASRESPIMAALFGGDRRAEAATRDAINRHAVARERDGHLKTLTRNADGMSPSNFGNTGTSVQAPGRYEQRFFDGSHGAMGGVPWDDLPGDSLAVGEVRSWMWSNFAREGL